MAGPVTKIYNLQTIGADVVHKDLQQINKDFIAIKKSKKEAQQQFAGTKSTAEAEKYRAEVQKIRVEEAELRKQRQQMINEAKAAQITRAAEIQQEKDRQKAAQASTGWYKNLTTQIRELSNAIKSVPKQGDDVTFRGGTLKFDEAINKLKQLTAAEQEFRRQFAKDKTLVGEYTTGIVQAFKQLGLDDLIAGQVTRTQTEINKLNSSFDLLQKELKETQAVGGATEVIERQMIENRNAVIKLDTELLRLRTDLRGTGDIGNQISTSIGKGFAAVKGQLSSLVVQYLGVQAVIQQAIAGINEAKLSSDQFTNLEIQLKGDAEAATNLNDSLKKLDTRTTLTGLQQIADIALRAGVTSANIADVTAAIDKAKVAFGKDFGSVEEGTETFAKLINIFFDDGQITGDRILKIGNAIRALANETVASVPFITDFSGRMAGVKQIANVTLPDILGLGAGFEEFKQSAETSSTVLVKLIPKIASDTKKFADVVGITQEQFQKLIDTNPAEALLQVSEALVSGGGDVKKITDTLAGVNLTSEQIEQNLIGAAGASVTEIAQALQDAELGSGRITTILATLGGKADIFRERIARAGETIGSTTAITDAFERKNNNLAATLDKVGKKIKDFFASTAFQTTLTAIFAVLGLIIDSLPVLITLFTAWSAAMIIANAELIKLKISTIASNIAFKLQYTWLVISETVTKAYAIAVNLLSASFLKAAASSRILTVSIRLLAGPIGIVLATLALVSIAIAAFGKGVGNAVSNVSAFVRQQKIMAEVNREVAKTTSDEIAKIDSWIAVVNAATSSATTKTAAMKELIKIDNAFNIALKDNVINLDALNEAYGRVIESIKLKGRVEASAKLSAQKREKLVAVQTLREDLEIQAAQATGETTFKVDLTAEQSAILKASNLVETGAIVSIGKRSAQILGFRFDQIKTFLNQKEKEAIDTYKDYLAVQARTQEELNQIEKKAAEEQAKTALQISKQFEVDIVFLKKQLADLNDAIDKFQGSKDVLRKMVEKRDKLQDDLNKLLNKQTPTAASRLSGVQKDAIKEIDAIRDIELAGLNRALIDQTDFIRREQDVIKIGEDGKLKIVKDRLAIHLRDEEDFLVESLRINVEAINKKLQVLKNETAEEKKVYAELLLERSKFEKETNDKIFELRAKALKDRLDTTVENAKLEQEKIEQLPNVSEKTKLQAKLKADQQILDAQVIFNDGMDKLEKERNFVSKKNQDDRARALTESEIKLQQDFRKIFEARIADEKEVGEKLLAEFKLILNKQREAILKSNKTPAQKQAALQTLDQVDAFGSTARQIAALEEQLSDYKKALSEKRITEKEYSDFYDGYVKKLEELNKILADSQKAITDVQGFVTNKLGKLFGFKENSAEAKLLAETISQSFALAQNAMDSFYDKEQQQIKQSLDLQTKRLEIERDQQLARAESKAEEESINKQFQAKKDAADREAFEKNKKIQREQAKINLAMQLSNLAVIAFAPNPLNIATLGAAGAIMYAIQAAIALANYAVNIARINSATLEQGGEVGGKKKNIVRRTVEHIRKISKRNVFEEKDDVPMRGGKFKGKTHKRGGTPFRFKGKQYEAEVDELAVIRTKSAPRNKKFKVEGTQMQIASAINRIGGGVDFRPGAKIRKMQTGGFIGQQLEAPIFKPSTLLQSSGEVDLSKLIDKLDEVVQTNKDNADAQSKRIDRLEVIQITSTVTNAQNKRVKQNNVGTIA